MVSPLLQELEHKMDLAALFQCIAADGIAVRSSEGFESIRTARSILDEAWTIMESVGEFPESLVARMMEIDNALAIVERALYGSV